MNPVVMKTLELHHLNLNRMIQMLSGIEMVSEYECDRHRNQQQYSRTILPVQKLCVGCQLELKVGVGR